MSYRRSKAIPGPLNYPEKAPATAGFMAPPPVAAKDVPAAPAAAAAAPTVAAAVVRPRLFRVTSPATAPPSVTHTSGVEPFSPGLNVYRSGGGAAGATSLAPKTCVLVDHHVTNTGAVVRLERVDYSKAMRAYRVCRQEGGGGGNSHVVCGGHSSSNGGNSSSGCGAALPLSSLLASASPTAGLPSFSSSAAAGTAANPTDARPTSTCGSGVGGVTESRSPAPWSVVLRRLFGAADMALVAIAVACFLVVVSRVRVSSRSSAAGAASPNVTAPSGLVSLLGSLVTHYGEQTRTSTRAANDDASRGALVPSHAAAVSSYSQPTHAASLDTSVTFALFFFSLLLLAKRLGSAVTRVYVEEVLVMRGVGLQFSSYGIFNTLRYKVFVNLQLLRSLVIHDAFFRYQPLFYLSSSVENRAERIVYFPDTLPRLAVLRVVLNGIRGVLYGESEEGPSLAELEERWKTSLGDVSGEEPFTEDSFAEDTVTTADEGHSSDGTDHE